MKSVRRFGGAIVSPRFIGGYRGFGFGLTSLLLVETATSIALISALSRGRRCYHPWYLQPQSRSGNNSKAKESWAVVVFDFAKSAFCSRLDKNNGIAKHMHEVPMDQFDIQYDVWEAPLDETWFRSKPTTHESVAAMIVTYNVKDSSSLEAARKRIQSASAKLIESEYDTYAALTVVLIGVTDVGVAVSSKQYAVQIPYGAAPGSQFMAQLPGDAMVAVTVPAGATPGSNIMVDAPPEDKESSDIQVSAAQGLDAAGQKAIFFEAPCATVPAVHDCMVSIGQEVMALAQKRRDEELERDRALSVVAKVMEGEDGWFGKDPVDVCKLSNAIKAAEMVGVHPIALQEAKRTLAKREEEEAQDNQGSLCCGRR